MNQMPLLDIKQRSEDNGSNNNFL